MDGARLTRLLAEKLNFIKTRWPSSGRRYLPDTTEESPTATEPSRETIRPLRDSPQSSIAGAEILPQSICPVCLNLGNEVWDTKYRKKHKLKRWEYHSHRISRTEVLSATKKSCSGCQIIVWALEPYMALLETREAYVNLNFNDLPGCSLFVVPDNWYGNVDGYLRVELKSSPFKLREESSHLFESKSWLRTVYI